MVTHQGLVRRECRECRSLSLYGGLGHREPAADLMAAIQQTVQATGVGLTTVYKIRSEAKSTGCLSTFYFQIFLFQKLMKR